MDQALGTRKATVVLVHNMWGNHKVLNRHVQMFQSLGHPCVTFDLYRGSTIKNPSPFPFYYYFNFMYLNWVWQIRKILDAHPGEKIIFAMSGPSISAIIACDGRSDVSHLICDGGPFREIWRCTFRLFTQVFFIPTWPLRFLGTTFGVLQWGWQAFWHSQKVLRRWPSSRPILSIRGAKDPLVFPENIDGIFKDHKNLKLTTWILAEGGHLDGLKKFPQDYKNKITDFLKS